MSVGLPPPCSARLAGAEVRCCGKCRALYEAVGHHAQKWCPGDDSALLPRPVLTGDDRHTDIKWDWPMRRGVAVVGGKSSLHPFVGKGKSTPWGTYTPRKLQDSVNGKDWMYAAFHR
eukprot:2200105-Rhodomonas_salina.2